MTKRDVSLFVVLLPTPSVPSLARNARRRGFFFCTPSTPLSLETRDGGGVSLVDTPPPTPPLLELRDGGVFSVNTPLPCSKCETELSSYIVIHRFTSLLKQNFRKKEFFKELYSLIKKILKSKEFSIIY